MAAAAAEEDKATLVEELGSIVTDADALKTQTKALETYLTTHGIDWALQLTSAIAIFFIGWWLARILLGVGRRIMQRSNLDEMLITFLGNVLYAIAFAVVVIAALGQLGVNTTSLTAIVAAAGLAIGLSLQSSLSNLAAGVMIVVFRPFHRGDDVEVANTAGNVREVSIFTTTLLTPDHKTIIVPNGSIISNIIINYSAQKTRRIDLAFEVSYQDDLRKVKALLLEIVTADHRILKDPEPIIAVTALGNLSVTVACRPWVKSTDYWRTYWDLMERVKIRFGEAGITIPTLPAGNGPAAT